jgi:hypothetical protein
LRRIAWPVTETDDDAAIVAQLGRPVRARADVVVRCHLGLPVVTRVPPRLDDGEPFPTRFWLTCPLAHRRIARIEAAGGVRAADARVVSDPKFAAAFAVAERAYVVDRDGAAKGADGPWPSGGVGGAVGGVKCLHAHYAHFLATGLNPVGAVIAPEVGACRCVEPCVRSVEGRACVRNPDWREPA